MIDKFADPNHRITSETQLRKLISHYPKILDKRIQPTLDHHCMDLIERAALVITAYNHSRLPIMPLTRSDVTVKDHQTLILNAELDAPESSSVQASLYFLLPGVGHGLRVNGEVSQHRGNVMFHVQRAYLHCARAAARSQLWDLSPHSPLPKDDAILPSPRHLLTHSPYLLLKTSNSRGETELSPRGDQPGFVHWIDDTQLFLPERPGNKVAVSMRNILQQPTIELLLFLPQSSLLMRVTGIAHLSTHPELLDLSTVQAKRPKLGIHITECHSEIFDCPAIRASMLWDKEHQVASTELTRFSTALSFHMNGEGLLGKATVPVVNAIVKNDLKHLY